MAGRPYISETSNVIKEESYKTEPAKFGNQNILVNHTQQRTICDRTATSITNNMSEINPFISINPSQQIPGRMQLTPDGVTYTFHPQAQNYALKNFGDYQAPPPQLLTLEQQIAMNQLQKNALECMLLQEKFKKNPFQLQFHSDSHSQTDTSNLQPACFCCNTVKSPLGLVNRSAIDEAEKIDIYAYNQRKPDKIFSDSSTQKRLFLKFEDQFVQTENPTPKLCDCNEGTAAMEMATAQNQTAKKVTFKDSMKNIAKNCKGKHKSKKTFRSVTDDSSDESSNSTNSSDDECNKEK